MKKKRWMTRRDLMKAMAITGTGLSFSRSSGLLALGVNEGWVKYTGNPVLGGQYGTCFDVCVLLESGIFRMWVSWRPKQSVAITESKDGISWKPPEIVLSPLPETGWEDDINRPVVVRRSDGYHMWYTGQAKGRSSVGYATSSDGRTWARQSKEPVLKPTFPWEDVAIMCPHAIWDGKADLWKMWYSAGTQYEPNAIGYATSADGLHWDKHPDNPILTPDPRHEWEQNRVAAAQILQWEGWYYAFYIGFRDIDHAQIGMARSKDGVTGWVRHAGNPIVRPTPGGWDSDACYKPFAVLSDGCWRLWYNGRQNHLEQIGLVMRESESLGFTAES